MLIPFVLGADVINFMEIRRLELSVAVKKIYEWSKSKYGSPRITKELQVQGKQVLQHLGIRL